MASVISIPAESRPASGASLAVAASVVQSAAAPLGALLVVALLAVYNLENYPRTWFDEGLNLLAARTLAESGRYGLETVDGFSAFDLGLSTGPTVLVPVALAFKLAGVGLVQARLVAVAYLLLAAGGLFWVARQAFGKSVGVVAILVFGSLSEAGPLTAGRQVLGEVAGLAFLWCGVGSLGVARRRDQDRLYLAAGVLFGLAVVSKNQLAVLIPVIAAIGLVAGRTDRHFSLWRLALVLCAAVIPTCLWYSFQLWTMGAVWFVEHLRGMSGEATASLAVAPLRRTPSALRELLASGFGAWGGAGLLYVWLLAIRDDWRRYPERLVLPLFTIVWLAFFLGLSIGWSRYAVPAVAIGSLFTAKLVHDLAAAARSRIGNPLGTALLALIAGSIASGLITNAISVQRASDTSPRDFAAQLTQYVDKPAILESSEWEIDFLTRQSYHHPPAHVIVESIGTVFLGRPSPAVAQYRAPASVRYIVDGPFSKLTGLYREELSAGSVTRIASSGEYELLRRNDR